jgi:hypothetical protein
MIDRLTVASPRRRARIAGLFYFLNILTGAFALVFMDRGLTVYGNAANIAAAASYIVVTLLFYELFKPVNKSLSLLAAFFSLVGCAIGALGPFHLAPSRINNLVFFGFYCLLIGYLIFRSTFLPRILGVLMAFGGLGWLTFLSSPLAKYLSPYNLAPGIVGEGALTVWLLVIGLNEQRWNEPSSAARESEMAGRHARTAG